MCVCVCVRACVRACACVCVLLYCMFTVCLLYIFTSLIQRSHQVTPVSIIMLVYLLQVCVSVYMYMCFFYTRHHSLLIVSCVCILGRRPLITKSINQSINQSITYYYEYMTIVIHVNRIMNFPIFFFNAFLEFQYELIDPEAYKLRH